MPGPDHLVAGRYRLRSRIGEGGMGSVWLAKDQLLNRDVAVKRVVSLEGLAEDSAEAIRAKAMREGRIAAKLAHRNAIAVHDVALDGGTPWLVMEYLPSRSVAQILHTVGTLPPNEVAQIGAQIAAAMAEAHYAGVLHRDIKPGNILVASSGGDVGLVKLTDFGIADFKDDTHATDDMVSGTPAYFAPEVARGAAASEASDVYSLGSTIYTMVEGKPPFGMDDDTTFLLDRVARARFDAPQQAGPLEPMLMAMLTPSPAKRPTMIAVRDQLAAIAAAQNRTTPDKILHGRISRPDGAVPVWALVTPRPPRLVTGSYQRSYAPAVTTGSYGRSFVPAPPPSTHQPPQQDDKGWDKSLLIVAGAVVLALLMLVFVLAM
ncbi:putative serine/threonine protein kinase [Gordonia araii NBRC 100433]|uniref:non-specific serine/threonine protein kinase n=1 Tax=Gordonia araii NBRC 100433 TaxID=1073574 RepID=G7GZT8_9ACTN|nr:putative serine/threonine protein kinase [Gordonia araii NBRC 100433]